jgi:predicted ATP-grasp superfamily ATP-dependent carboligase
MTDHPLIILGASARAAAQSAQRAGFSPHAIDLFGDADLRAIASVTQIQRYPAEFLPALAAAPNAPWMYIGGLENYPRLVARLARLRPLLGNGPLALAKVRDPRWLAETLHGEVVRFPQTIRLSDSIPDAASVWLRKPRRSGGGLGIHRFALDSSTARGSSRSLLQRFIPGESLSATFLAHGGHAKWIGAAEQWIGTGWGAPGEFQYAGSLTPANITAEEQTNLLNLAQRLTEDAGLQGLFGLDLVRDQQGWWLIEVNPRYTASMELHERRSGRALIAEHCAVFQASAMAISSVVARSSNSFDAKLIVYATCAGIAGDAFCNALDSLTSNGITTADIPMANSPIQAHSPICTLFASGDEREAIRHLLLTSGRRVRYSLSPSLK